MARLKQAGPPREVLTPAPMNPKHLTDRQNGIPAQFRAADKEGEQAAQDGTTAGADGMPPNPNTAPGSNKSIPAPFRDAIVTPAGFHVP
jgi:hypothetical protein